MDILTGCKETFFTEPGKINGRKRLAESSFLEIETFPTGKGANKPTLKAGPALSRSFDQMTSKCNFWYEIFLSLARMFWTGYKASTLHYIHTQSVSKVVSPSSLHPFTNSLLQWQMLLVTVLHSLGVLLHSTPPGMLLSPTYARLKIDSLPNYNVKLLLKPQNRWPALTWCA